MITVLHLITSLETGGAQRMLSELVAHIQRSRFRSVVVSMTGPGTMGRLIEAQDVTLCHLGMFRGLPDPRGFLRLVRLCNEFQPCILQTWLYHADLLGLMVQQFVPSTRLSWNIRCTETIGRGWLIKLLAWCSGHPDAVVVNSDAGKRYHNARGYRPRRWVVIPNGIDTRSFHPDTEVRRRTRAELGIEQHAVAILLPARYHPMKDHANFLTAAALLARRRPDVRFAFAGAEADANNRALLRAVAANQLNERVQLLGNRRDLQTLYLAFDIVTLSSAYGEGFPNVLGEAMSCGVPCVATDSGDASQIIGDTGLIVPPRDPAALAAAWQQLVELGAEDRMALGRRARARIVEYYEINCIVARFEALYEDLDRLRTPQGEGPFATCK
jgi:glycosyltransferase involved in cell wall biosynthesis